MANKTKPIVGKHNYVNISYKKGVTMMNEFFYFYLK